MNTRRCVSWVLACGLGLGSLSIAGGPQESPFEPEIVAYEAADKVNPPQKDGIVFVGSSSIKLWKTLKQDFPGKNVIGRGFGGSQLSDSIKFAKRIITPYKPKMIVLFAGTNDIASGKTAETVAADFGKFVSTVRAELPNVRIAFISLSPSPVREARWPVFRKANDLIRKQTIDGENLGFIDVFPAMLNESGGPRPEIFVSDRLHMNADGYKIWKKVVGPFLPW